MGVFEAAAGRGAGELARRAMLAERSLRDLFPHRAFHGTASDIVEIDPAMFGSMTGTKRAQAGLFSASNPVVGGQYAVEAAKRRGGSPNVIPLRLRFDDPMVVEGGGRPIAFAGARPTDYLIEQALDEGRDGVIFRNVFDSPWGHRPSLTDVFLNFRPNHIRTASAAFKDPDSFRLLASLIGAAAIPGGAFGALNQKARAE